VYELITEYLNSRTSERLPVLELEIPCSTECLNNSRFKDLLSISSFKSQVEVIDSLKDLINYKINNLLEDISGKISDRDSVDLNSLAYSVYKIIEFGGDYEIGYETLRFENKTIFVGTFSNIMKLSKEIEKVISDDNIKSICNEIRYLTESLWEHFDKNIRRALNEVQNRA